MKDNKDKGRKGSLKDKKQNISKISRLKEKPTTSGLKQKPRKTLRRNEKGKENDAYFCSVCHEPYEDLPNEDWIQCSQCQVWTHELCTTYTSFGSYFCDICADE